MTVMTTTRPMIISAFTRANRKVTPPLPALSSLKGVYTLEMMGGTCHMTYHLIAHVTYRYVPEGGWSRDTVISVATTNTIHMSTGTISMMT